MPAIAQIYTESVYDNLKPLYANWDPGRPVQLGDYGTVQDRNFMYLGNVSQLGIAFDKRADPRRDHKYFASKGATDVTFHAKGSAPVGGAVNAKASLQVQFSSEEGVFFNAAQCEYVMVADKVALGVEIMRRLDAGEWKKQWAIVTDLVNSGSTTIAVSGASSAEIAFEAEGEVPQIDLADASLGLAVRKVKNVGYQVVAASGLVPLIGLAKVQPKFWIFGEEFKPLARSLAPDAGPSAEPVDPEETREPVEGLYFGQLR
jgi:hypothetical protein